MTARREQTPFPALGLLEALDWLEGRRCLRSRDLPRLERLAEGCWRAGGCDAAVGFLRAAWRRHGMGQALAVSVAVVVRRLGVPAKADDLVVLADPVLARARDGGVRRQRQRLRLLQALARRTGVTRDQLLLARLAVAAALAEGPCDGWARHSAAVLVHQAGLPLEVAEMLMQLLAGGCDCQLLLSTWLDW